MTQPFRGPGGLYLVRVESIVPSVLPEFKSIEDEVRRALEPRVLPYEHAYLIDHMSRDPKNALYPYAWESYHDERWLARVGEYSLTIGDFQRLLPGVITPDCLTNKTLLTRDTHRIYLGQLILQSAQAYDVTQDPRARRARELAPAVLRGMRLLEIKELALPAPTREVLERYYADNRDLFEALPYFTLGKVVVTVKHSDTRTAVERLDLIAQAKEQLKPLMAAVSESIRRAGEKDELFPAQTAPAAGATTASLTTVRGGQLVNALEAIDNTVYDVNVTREQGYLTETVPADVTRDQLETMKAFDVLGPLPDDERAVFWVCLELKPIRTPPYSEIAEAVRTRYNATRTEAAREALLAQYLPAADMTWLYDQLSLTPQIPRVKDVIPERVVPAPKKKGGKKPI